MMIYMMSRKKIEKWIEILEHCNLGSVDLLDMLAEMKAWIREDMSLMSEIEELKKIIQEMDKGTRKALWQIQNRLESIEEKIKRL